MESVAVRTGATRSATVTPRANPGARAADEISVLFRPELLTQTPYARPSRAIFRDRRDPAGCRLGRTCHSHRADRGDGSQQRARLGVAGWGETRTGALA